jgi:hypothetical protein
MSKELHMSYGVLPDGWQTEVDPLVLAFTEEFEAGVVVLQESQGDEHRKIAKALCELSRDIRLRLGPPEQLPAQFVANLARLFTHAADSILAGDDKELLAYRKNIVIRAVKLQPAKVVGAC